ncbi:putative NLR Family CARD Domain Containing protein [Blattamonas nauphoetae]|uniref:NLR Family CARD Domain Containing protein n=1 Tax=Blattamonas nauphoetae TaxID=2049346 RepID=A0ABQ9YN11_9EUKA|nr:putative NLR Family CARD Domain Containing protein [Blattamonas nauphoetae]
MNVEEFIQELYEARAKDNDEEPHHEDLEMLKRRIILPLEQGRLSLSKLRLGVNSAIVLAKNLRKHDIRHIDLSNNIHGDIGCVAVMQLAQTNQTLKYLNMESNDISDEGSISIGHMLASNHSIEQLLLGSCEGALHGNSIGHLGSVSIFQGLQQNTTLKKLGLNNNPFFSKTSSSGAVTASKIGEKSADPTELLCDIVSTHPNLTSLELGGTKMQTKNAVSLFTAMKPYNYVTELDLRDNPGLGFQAFDALSALLTENRSIERLNLANCKLTARGADTLSRALVSNRTLKELNLSSTGIEDYGLHEICHSLIGGENEGEETNSTLTILDLSDCGCTATGCTSLAAVLSNPLTNITRLILKGNSLGSGVKTIAEALSDNNTVEYVDFSSCKIEDDGAIELFNTLSVNTTITTLLLHSNFISNKLGQEFLQLLAPNTTLLRITLQGSLLPRQVQSDIQRITTQNQLSKKNFGPNRMKEEIAHLLRELEHLPKVVRDLRHTRRQIIRVNKEISKVEGEIKQIQSQSDELTTQLQQQLTEQRKQVEKKQSDRDEKARELKEAQELNEKNAKDLENALKEEEFALSREVNERFVMSMADIESLFFTYESEKERTDGILNKINAEIEETRKKGEKAALTIKYKGGKPPAAPKNRPMPKK